MNTLQHYANNGITNKNSGNMQSFGQNSAPKGMAMTINSREVARIQGEIFMAKQYPRDISKAVQQIQVDCQNLDLATKAVYRYARGSSNISGPSIRLAEELAGRLGNIRYGFEELDVTEANTTVRAYAYDIEGNSQSERIFLVPHMRFTKRGSYKLTDPRDIYEAVANQASRRVRACILAVIPADIVEFAVQTCSDTLKKSINMDQKTKNALLEAFKKFDVTKEMIEKRIQRNYDSITVDQVVELRQTFASIKEGIGKASDFFDFTIVKDTKNKKSFNENAKIIPNLKDINSNNDIDNNDYLDQQVLTPNTQVNQSNGSENPQENFEDITFGNEKPNTPNDGFNF